MNTNPICRACGVELNDDNWTPSRQINKQYICTPCENKRALMWRRANPEKAKAIGIRQIRKRGALPFGENKGCALYLGIHVAERVLSRVFKDVVAMPISNPGYDFVCGRGKRIDVKSSCIRKCGKQWSFRVNRNTIADYFLLLAFDNRTNLTPLHMWLIPGNKINHLVIPSISKSTLHKWDDYRLSISKVIACCDTLRH